MSDPKEEKKPNPDDVLRRMLNTPPDKGKQGKGKKESGSAGKKQGK